jgi:hypothetical protein
MTPPTGIYTVPIGESRGRAPRIVVLAALGLAVAAGTAPLVWQAAHCRAFAPHQHYVVPGAAMCTRGTR